MKIKTGMKGRVTLVFLIMGIVLSLGVGAVTYTLILRQALAQYTGFALSAAKMAASVVDGDEIDAFLRDGPNDAYDGTHESLREITAIHNLMYLYILKPDDERTGFFCVFDLIGEGGDPSTIREPGAHWINVDENYNYYQNEYNVILETYLTGYDRNSVITDNHYGYVVTAFAPVYGSDKSITAVVGADISMNTILRSVRRQTFWIAGTAIGIIALFLVITLLAMQRRILSPIVQLSRHMASFDSSEGELREIRIMSTGKEIQTMAESFNRMIGDIRLYMENLATVTADRERVSAELNVAAGIQACMLPRSFPAFPDRKEFDIYALMLPAREVGGDFYDFFLVDDNTLAVVMADVSDKGVPAALFMVSAKTLIKNNAQSGKSPKEVFETVNNMLCENNDAGVFVTAFMGYLDIPTGKFVYVNAGHNPPLLRTVAANTTDGRYERLNVKSGFLLAVIEDNGFYEQGEVTLQPGDALFLYTDGVNEAVNNKREMFGDSRLLEAANRCLDLNPEDFIAAIRRELYKFADGAEQADDITMLALRYCLPRAETSTPADP